MQSCQLCGKPITTRGAKSFCSIQCRNIAMSKQRWANQSQDRIRETCKLCGKPIMRRRAKSFCSIRCRNIANSRQRIPWRPKDASENLPEGARKYRVCPSCGNVGHRILNICNVCRGVSTTKWTNEMDDFLRLHYVDRGCEFCAIYLGMSRTAIYSRSDRLGLYVAKDTMRNLLYDPASERMKESNPMFNPESVEKMKQFYIEHPDAQQANLDRLHQGRCKMQKGNPTKLELKLFAILDTIGIEYERFFVIKDKFIVDCRIGNLIIEADGDYWHGHPRFYPLTDRQIAQQKRDRSKEVYLQTCGYTIERIWECEMNEAMVIQILQKHNLIRTG